MQAAATLHYAIPNGTKERKRKKKAVIAQQNGGGAAIREKQGTEGMREKGTS